MHLLILTQNNIAPAEYGGGLRVLGLARQLLERGDRVSVIRFVSPGEPLSAECSDRLWVRDVPTPRGYPMSPLATLFHMFSSRVMEYALEMDSMETIDAVQSDAPWAALTGGRVAGKLGVPHVVLSQNCETALARQFTHEAAARKLPLVGGLIADFNLGLLRRAEKSAIERAKLTLTPSHADIAEMEGEGINTGRVTVLPNGTSFKPAPEARHGIRTALGLGAQEQAAIFVGRMDYLPNREAIDLILNVIAPACPGVKFLLVGSNPPQIETAPNVILVGQVERVEPYLAAADVSIVPLLRGSGTRIKILDAWASGLPIISTTIGASGLNYSDGQNIVIEDDPAMFPHKVTSLLNSPTMLQTLSQGALSAASPYTWEAIGGEYIATLQALAGVRSYVGDHTPLTVQVRI